MLTLCWCQVCLIEAKLGEAGERSQALAAHVEELKESVKHAAQQQKEHTAAAEGKLAAVQTELGAQLGAEKEKVMKLEDATASSKRAAADAERYAGRHGFDQVPWIPKQALCHSKHAHSGVEALVGRSTSAKYL